MREVDLAQVLKSRTRIVIIKTLVKIQIPILKLHRLSLNVRTKEHTVETIERIGSNYRRDLNLMRRRMMRMTSQISIQMNKMNTNLITSTTTKLSINQLTNPNQMKLFNLTITSNKGQANLSILEINRFMPKILTIK